MLIQLIPDLGQIPANGCGYHHQLNFIQWEKVRNGKLNTSLTRGTDLKLTVRLHYLNKKLVGQSIWRLKFSHFTGYSLNWQYTFAIYVRKYTIFWLAKLPWKCRRNANSTTRSPKISSRFLFDGLNLLCFIRLLYFWDV